jgi:uncharacterized membrane protein
MKTLYARHFLETAPRRFVLAMLGLSVVAVCLLAVSMVRNHTLVHWYLVWNLFLAWLPLLFVARLRVVLRDKPWSSWEGIILTLLWLLFLPNSFYMVSDFIHLQTVAPGNILYDAVMFMTFIITALVIGYTSLYWVHVHLRQRLKPQRALGLVGLVLLACSFAIYLGRDLRWNSWDVIFSPAGVLFDVSDRVLHPLAHPDAFGVTAIFFIFLASVYLVVLTLVDTLRASPKSSKNLLH